MIRKITFHALSTGLFLLLTAVTYADSDLPRTHSGKPDFNGIWQANTAAFWNIEAHDAYALPPGDGDVFQAARADQGIVTGGTIPYTPSARKEQQQRFARQQSDDPVRKCFMPGVPRANYMPYPLQIVQTPEHLFFAYEFAQASRTLYVDQPGFEAPVDTWMGHSLARWEGDTLVVDVTSQVADT